MSNTGDMRVGNGSSAVSSGPGVGGASYIDVINSLPLQFLTNNAERMRISANGNVGIGISPSYPLDVLGQARFNNSVGVQVAPSSNIAINIDTAASQHGIITDSNTSTYYGLYSTGNVNGATGVGGVANVSGSHAAYFGDGAGNNCQFNYGSTAWSCSSDARRKTDIKPIGNPLGRLAQIRGVTFHWKKNPATGEKMGVIAQEVLKVFPEAVTQETPKGDNPGYYQVVYDSLIGPLISGVNELNVRTVDLPAKIERLEKSNAGLKADNDNLHALIAAQGHEIDTLKAKMAASH